MSQPDPLSPHHLVLRFRDFKQANGAAEALKKHIASWSASDWNGVLPDVVLVNDRVALHHARRGGFVITGAGDDVDEAAPGQEAQGPLTISASFRLPMGKPGVDLGKDLRAFFDQAKTTGALRDWKTAPFGVTLEHGEAKDVAFCTEGSSFELYLPASPAAIDAIKKFLLLKKVEQLKLRLCEHDDRKRLVKTHEANEVRLATAVPIPSAFASTPGDSGTSDWPTIGRRFLFTGKMATLVRDDAKKRVEWLGGIAATSVARDLDYLVVGDDGSPLYGNGAKGSKIVAVEKLQAHGEAIKIISEKQFLELKKR